jgi:hypothetical protein
MYADKHLAEEQQKGMIAWLKRLGVYGFLFFFAKGLVWIVVLGVLPYFGLSL